MLLLALDTSTRQSSIALCSEDGLYAEYSWISANNHSVELLDRIQRLLADCHFTLSHIDALAVATGPGSFNGVRVAVASAKALAFALQKPLVGISTLELLAAQQQPACYPVCAVLEAGRSELYAACYLPLSQPMTLLQSQQQLGEYLLCSPQHLLETLREHAHDWFAAVDVDHLPALLFCGELTPISCLALQELAPEHSIILSGISASRRASTLAQLAYWRLQNGQSDDPLVLEPLYLRRPSITKSTRKQPLLGGTTQRPDGPPTIEREEGALRH